MSKYQPLSKLLTPCSGESVTLSFGEIADTLGFLPESARKHRAWWSNGASKQACAWASAGWRVDRVDFEAERVTFARGKAERGTSSVFHEANTGQGDPPGGSLLVSWRWRALGSLRLDAGGKVSFPMPPATGGLYRFQFASAAAYVGEAQDFRQRFRGYRSPGKGTPTNLRLNQSFVEALSNGEEVFVAIAEEAEVAGERRDLSQKWTRVLVEHAAIHAEQQAGTALLNL